MTERRPALPTTDGRARARTSGILAVLVVLGGGPLAGQADSLAAAARGYFRQAAAAERQGEVARARDLLLEAHRAWPVQPAYLLAAADLSARLADTAGTARLLGALADLGASLDLGRRESFAPVRDAPALAEARRRLAENGRALAASKPVATIPDSTFFPEGMDYDPRSRAFFVASIHRRTIVRIAPDGRVSDFPLPGVELDAVLAVRVDPARDLLWATTGVHPAMTGPRPADSLRARVWAFELATGRALGMAEVPRDGAEHTLGDLAVHPTGDVYLTDSSAPILFRARLGGGGVTVEPVLRHRLFRSLQGLAFDRDGRTLYVADYSHGLLRVDPAAGSVREVPPPAGATAVGLDGIARSGNALIAIQNGIAPARVVRLDLTPDGDWIAAVTVLDRHLPVADEPTIGAIAGDQFVYVANSQWEKYDGAGRRRPGTALAAPVLLGLPLPRR